MATVEERQKRLQAAVTGNTPQPQGNMGVMDVLRREVVGDVSRGNASEFSFVPPARTEAMGSLGRTMTFLQNELNAAFQGVFPDMPEENRLGRFFQAPWGPSYVTDDDRMGTVDGMEHVILNDPETGEPTVYRITPEVEESRVMSLARVLSFGFLDSPATPSMAAKPNRALSEGIEAFDQAGVDPSIAATAQSRTARTLTNTLNDSVTSAGVMERGAQRTIGQTAQAVERTAATAGRATDPLSAGESAIRGARRFVGAADDITMADDLVTQIIRTPTRNVEGGFLKKAKALFQRSDEFFSPGEVVGMDSAMDALRGVSQRFQNAELGAEFVSPRLARWGKIIEEGGGTLSYNDLRLFRTEVGRMLRSPQALFDTTTNIDDLKALYSALTDDLVTFAKSKGDDAVKAVRESADYYKAGADRIRGALERILKPDASGEDVFNMLVRKAGEKGGADLRELQSIRRSMDDEAWGDVSAAVIRQMGKAAPGSDAFADFSVAAFMTNYRRLSESGKEIIFGGAGRKELVSAMDNLSEVIGRQKNVQALANHSGTGRVTITGGLGVLAFFDPVTAAGAGISAHVAARLMMNPQFVRWLAEAPTVAWQTVEWGRHAGRLRMIGVGSAEQTQAVNQVMGALGDRGVNIPPPDMESVRERQKLLQQRLEGVI